MSDLWYLFLAYGIIWLGLVGYVFRLGARADSLLREVSLLRGMLQEVSAEAEEGRGPAVASAAAPPGETEGGT